MQVGSEVTGPGAEPVFVIEAVAFDVIVDFDVDVDEVLCVEEVVL